MSSKVIVRGELIFENKEDLYSFFSKLGITREKLELGKVDTDDLKVLEIREDDGRYHVRFEGDINWPSRIAPSGENPLDWLKTKVAGLVWDVDDLKTLEVFRRSEGLKFSFYSDEELDRKREEYNKWWMDSASNIVGLF